MHQSTYFLNRLCLGITSVYVGVVWTAVLVPITVVPDVGAVGVAVLTAVVPEVVPEVDPEVVPLVVPEVVPLVVTEVVPLVEFVG